MPRYFIAIVAASGCPAARFAGGSRRRRRLRWSQRGCRRRRRCRARGGSGRRSRRGLSCALSGGGSRSCLLAEQRLLLREAGASLRGERGLPARLLCLQRRDLGLDRGEQLPPLREHGSDLPPLRVQLADRDSASVLGCAGAPLRLGGSITRGCCLDGEPVIGLPRSPARHRACRSGRRRSSYPGGSRSSSARPSFRRGR